MRRWNVKGSSAAKERMARLRDDKLQKQKSLLIWQWNQRFGKSGTDWWKAAQAAGLHPGCGAKACIDFLTGQLREAC